MIYFDTNVLVYFSIDQDPQKFEIAKAKIFHAIKEDRFILSSLVMSEYIFVLTKLGILNEQKEKVEFFFDFAELQTDRESVKEAFVLCQTYGSCKNINDAVHFVLAKKNCQKLITFDKDFKRFKDDVLIEIL